MPSKAQWNNSRGVSQRIFIRGILELETPAHFGNGDSMGLIDMPLLYDAVEEKTPLLTGASIAGALRNYVREYEAGFGAGENRDGKLIAEQLFGHLIGNTASVESWLMIDDALGTLPGDGLIEIRDGVTIDPKTRTAEEGKKYDIELLAAGTTFPLNFELWLPYDTNTGGIANLEILQALATALSGLENGEIGLGMRKRRGYGRCRVKSWQLKNYDMQTVEGLIGWLDHSEAAFGEPKTDICKLLDVTPIEPQNERRAFKLEASFRLKGSLLIRSDSGSSNAVDAVHLRSWRNGKARPIVSGTSLAGVIRHRALRIAKTLFEQDDRSQKLINGMFGRRIESPDDVPSGSRVIIEETVVKHAIEDRIQNRVKIDRFTGGAYPQALFSQQPLFAKAQESTLVTVKLELRQLVQENEEMAEQADQTFRAEIGLLLLVLKDLWTGDLAIGGESSVGRGCLEGQSAKFSLDDDEWTVQQTPSGQLEFDGTGDIVDLENKYLAALVEWEG